MHMLFAIFSIILLGHLPVDDASLEDFITRCAEERVTIVLDRDIQINKDVVFYKIKGQGHTINVGEGVSIKTKDDDFSVKDVTFVINEYGNKNDFSIDRGRLIQSTARNVRLKSIIVRTGKEGELLKYDATSGWRGRSFLLISNAERIRISNITSYNIGMLVTYDNSHNAKIKNVVSYNCETNQYIKPTCSNFSLSDVEIRNRTEDKYWIIGGMSGKGTNEKNVILSGAWNCRFKRITGENCIERVVYSRGGGNIKATDLSAINCGGFKFVGQNEEETDWVRNVKVKNCRWIRTEPESKRLMLLKANFSPESRLTVAASNLDVFQINKIDGVEFDGVYVEDRTGENSASISSVNKCRNVMLSNWILRNIRCSRPVIYITDERTENAVMKIKNMTLHNYAPSNRVGESVLVGYRTTVPKEECVLVECNNVRISNDEGNVSKKLLGEGIRSHSLDKISINGGLANRP